MISTRLLFYLFRLLRTIDNGAIFNVIVLIGSLIGSVIVGFTVIMQTLEEYCRISTDEPNKDAITPSDDATADEIMGSMELVGKGKPSTQELGQAERESLQREIGDLKDTIRLLARITKSIGTPNSGDGADLHNELDRQLASMTAAPQTYAYDPNAAVAIAVARQTSSTASDPNPAPPASARDNTYSGDGSLRSRRWSAVDGWVGCHVGDEDGPSNVISAAAVAVEMTQIAVPARESQQLNVEHSSVATTAAAEVTHATASTHNQQHVQAAMAQSKMPAADAAELTHVAVVTGDQQHAHSDITFASESASKHVQVAASTVNNVDAVIGITPVAVEREVMARDIPPTPTVQAPRPAFTRKASLGVPPPPPPPPKRQASMPIREHSGLHNGGVIDDASRQ
jgi:hypothetical protein